MLYKGDEKGRISEHDYDEAEDDFQDSIDEDGLLESYTSSNGLEMEYEENRIAEWRTLVKDSFYLLGFC